ncbi:MAG: glycosyltransferase family 4 protein [bacterium]|nr:glycosyltransferase family 4 protein [bacterium]
MKILMISTDKTLLGLVGVGDAPARHKEYAKCVERLDILVLTKKTSSEKALAPNCVARPLVLNFDFFGQCRRQFKSSGYDLIVCQDPFLTAIAGWDLKRKFGAKLLIHFHGDFWKNKNWLYERWYNIFFLWVSKFTVRKADGLRVMSEGQKRKLLSCGWPSSKVTVVSTPVDIVRFIRYKEERIENQKLIEKFLSQKPGQEKKIVLMVARKDLVKDFDTMFRAMNLVFENNPETVLWLVGNFSAMEAYDLGLDQKVPVMEIGQAAMPTEDLPACYYASDVVALPSLSESFGKVLVEANACGKPVVATATTGAKQIVEEGRNGFLVPIKDYRALAGRIIYLLERPEEARRMGEEGRKMALDRYSGNTEKIIRLWEQIAK